MPWDNTRQHKFASDLCCLLIACNIVFNAVEMMSEMVEVQHYWHYFFEKWVPGSLLPGQYTLAGHILDEEADKVLNRMKAHVKGRFAMGQCNGWKNIAKTSLVTSMLNVEYKPYILGAVDISARQKNAKNLLEIVTNEIKYCQDVLGVVLVVWCTDSSGESLKMHHLLHDWFPWIVVVVCWAHQVGLSKFNVHFRSDFT
ncbi:hypothetical protein C8Q72DRAFT_777221 [Fomitopsis betulina]|nr:hypothetical protein C8Q72DRAFT_777221 [Fomitopsis betulina]